METNDDVLQLSGTIFPSFLLFCFLTFVNIFLIFRDATGTSGKKGRTA